MSIENSYYSDLPYTTMPASVDTFDRKIDIDITTKPLMEQYYSLMEQNDFDSIITLLENNPKLSQAVVTAKDWNRLRDGLIATQRLFVSDIGEYIVTYSRPKGIWNKTTKYRKYDVVTYTVGTAIQSYVAMPIAENNQDIPIGTLPTDTNYFICITLRGEKGESGSGMTPRGKYLLGTQYYTDDLVSYDNAFWCAIQNSIDQTPNDHSASWIKMMQFSGDLLIFDNSNTSLSSTTLQNAIVELDRKLKCIKNVTIPAGGFINNVYTYRNNIIQASYEPRVNFMEASIMPATKCGIIVQTHDGYITFKTRKIPTADLKIETIMLTATF